MDEACDRCGPAVRSVYRAVGGGELYLCRHCADRLWPALSAQGWTMWPVAERDRVPQQPARTCLAGEEHPEVCDGHQAKAATSDKQRPLLAPSRAVSRPRGVGRGT